MFDKLTDQLASAFKSLKGQGKITESNIEEVVQQVKVALLEADVNIKVVKAFIQRVKDKAIGSRVFQKNRPDEQFIKILHDELKEIMGNEGEELEFKRPVTLVMMVGLNGVGKTTFCAKLANHLKKQDNKEVLLLPLDTERPAAKEQLQTLASKINVDCFDSDLSKEPYQIALQGLAYAKTCKKNVIILDTAGRFHVNEELMGQLKKLKDSLKNYHLQTLLVADAMTGQESVKVAQSFNEVVGLNGVALSKMDSDAKGGASLSIKYMTNVPILYSSHGEKVEDVERFHPDRVVKRILDMGDILTLLERAEKAIDEESTEKMMENLKKNKFTADDFLSQLDSLKKMGSFSGLMKLIPGMGQVMKNMPNPDSFEGEVRKMKVIIGSMTKKEKDDYKIINDSRKKRLARGSGTPLKEVDEFMVKFDQMAQMMGGVGKALKKGRMPNMEELMGAAGGMGPRGFRAGKKQKGKGKGKKNPFGKSYF